MTRGDFVHGRRDESLFDMVFRCVIFFFFLIRMFVRMMKFCLIVRKKWERRPRTIASIYSWPRFSFCHHLWIFSAGNQASYST